MQLYILPTECHNSGQFNSITSHFRGKRSVDFTYKEDVFEREVQGDEPSLVKEKAVKRHSRVKRATLDEDALRINSVGENVTRDTEVQEHAKHHHEVVPVSTGHREGHGTGHADGQGEHHHDVDSMMDVVDVRIEGVENLMADMKKTIKRLSRKVTTCTVNW